MRLLIIGANGGTGLEIVRQALDGDHDVTAFVRDASRLQLQHERLKVVVGNVLAYDTVVQTMPGHDAVLSALGHKRWFSPNSILSEGTRNIIRAMQEHGVRRLICETSLGVGNSFGRMGLYYTLFVFPCILPFYFWDKDRQEKVIRSSDIDWTIVRPGQLTNGRRRGVYKQGANLGSFLWTVRISRADVADFMLNQIGSETNIRKSVGVCY